MPFDDLLDNLNQIELDVFGDSYILTRAEDGEDVSIDGILQEGAQPEDLPPGDGSTYALFWTAAGVLDPEPLIGDELATLTTIYKILRVEADAGRGLMLLLRKDRDVT